MSVTWADVRCSNMTGFCCADWGFGEHVNFTDSWRLKWWADSCTTIVVQRYSKIRPDTPIVAEICGKTLTSLHMCTCKRRNSPIHLIKRNAELDTKRQCKKVIENRWTAGTCVVSSTCDIRNTSYGCHDGEIRHKTYTSWIIMCECVCDFSKTSKLRACDFKMNVVIHICSFNGGDLRRRFCSSCTLRCYGGEIRRWSI